LSPPPNAKADVLSAPAPPDARCLEAFKSPTSVQLVPLKDYANATFESPSPAYAKAEV
jgi:hypothetical protein